VNWSKRSFLKRLTSLVLSPGLEPAQQAARIHLLERDIVLPTKWLLVLTLLYYFYFAHWTQQTPIRDVAFDTIRGLFLAYTAVNVVAAGFILGVRTWPLNLIQWMVFALGLLDSLLLAALTLITGGFDSILYWLFLGLIIHHAIAIPHATPQITLNVLVSVFYAAAGILDVSITEQEATLLSLDLPTRHAIGLSAVENPTEPVLLRVIVLLLLTACGYGVQALFERQRRTEAEAEEFLVQQERLQTAGRLAAEIAHQIKNPLAIITNTAFTLQRALKEGRDSAAGQIEIIREEVERADRIITELMGYAKLSEGRVERLEVAEELERAIAQVFPPGAAYDIHIVRDYGAALPSLMMQRAHLSEVLVNILQNAREALNGRGNIEVGAHPGENYSIVITIADDGPGIPPDKVERIFEPYFTTKQKGTGLGLAIVKQNAELNGGSVRVESELGHGTKFIIQFPGKTLLRLMK
jgi:signal transduction histidine kinase